MKKSFNDKLALNRETIGTPDSGRELERRLRRRHLDHRPIETSNPTLTDTCAGPSCNGGATAQTTTTSNCCWTGGIPAEPSRERRSRDIAGALRPGSRSPAGAVPGGGQIR